MRDIKIILFIAIFLTALSFAQNRYVYVLNKKCDKDDRIYLLDGNDLFNPSCTYLISYLCNDSIERVKFHTPFSASSTRPLSLPYTSNLKIETIWKSDIKNGNIHNIGIISDSLIIFKNQNGEFQCINANRGTYNTPENLFRNKGLSKDSLTNRFLLNKTFAVTSNGNRGFIIHKGKVFTFPITGNNVGTPSSIEKIPGNVKCIQILGNNKLLYIHENKLSAAEIRDSTVLHTFDLKIKGKDKLENCIIESIQLNPADPCIAAVVARGAVDSPDMHYLCLGYLNFSRKTIKLETIRPQKSKMNRIIFSCVWSPDGQYLAVLTSLSSKSINEGIGQLTTISFDVLNQKFSPYRFFKLYDHFVKISSGILWSPDGAYLFYVEKDGKKEYLAYVNNRMRRHHSWKQLIDENKEPFRTITGLGGPACIYTEDNPSMRLFISGTVDKYSVVCETVDTLPFLEPQPSNNGLPPNVFNSRLSSIDEVIDFEEIIKERESLSKRGTVNILQYLKDLKIPIASDCIKRGFKHYCLNIINKLSRKKPKINNYSQMTLADLKASKKVEKEFINQQKKDINDFISQRKSYIEAIVKLERQIDNLKTAPAASCVLFDSIVNVINLEAADSIRRGGDLSSIYIKLSNIKKNLDRLYKRYTFYDEYHTSYQDTEKDINQILLSSAGLNDLGVNYAIYLTEWDSTLQEFNNNIHRAMSTYALTNTETTYTANSFHLDIMLQEYAAFGQPVYFHQASKNFNKYGTKGLNKYFTLNKKAFLITAGSGVLFIGTGMIFNLCGKNNLQNYNEEKYSADKISMYKTKTKREYALGYISYTIGGISVSLSAYYLLDHILRKRAIKTSFTYDPKSSTIVWRF